MKALYALCLSLAAFAFVRPAQAELEYLVYDLSTKTTETVTNPDVTADEYHTGSEMLFVRDPNVADQTYYIGVFEVTQAQAKQLDWTGASEGGGWAYGTNTEGNFATAVKPLPKNLAFPTYDQWVAYTDDPATLTDEDKEDINIRDGASPTYRNISLVDWYKNHLCDSSSQLLPNSHGVYDIYGNVAEYATGGKGKGPFYGGAAASADSFAKLLDTSFDKLRLSGKPASRYNENNANVCGARLVYMPPKEQFYSVTVTLDNDDVTAETVKVPKGMDPAALAVGTSVTVTPPTPAAGKRLSGYTVTPDTLTFTEAPDGTLTFNMPTSDVTIAYTSEPYGTITVKNARMRVNEGEWVTTAQVAVGDTVTLEADEPGQYQFFSQWTGAQLDEDTLSVDEALMGKETVIEAVYQYYPRVLVVGGTATVAEEDTTKSFGNGYYAQGTVLTLEAETLSGYKFSGWTVDKADMADALDTERGTYTIGANDAGTTVTLTASYEYDESGESGTVTPADIHLGSTLAEGVYTAHPLFGWTPRTMETTVTDETSNRYHVYPYVAAGLYANLDLTTGKVVYSDSLSQGETSGGSSMPSPPLLWQYEDFEAYQVAFEAWKKAWNEWEQNQGTGNFDAKQLPLRRVIPTDGTAEFYLGVYETAMGHVENLNALRAGKEPSSSSAAAYCGKHGGDEVCENWPSAFNTLRTNLNETFFGGAERVRYPTQNDLLRVAQTSITNENPDAGKGYPADKNLTSAMVIGGGSTAKPDNVNAMTPCYGFYGLWGNGWETDKDGNGFAGSAYYSHTAQRAFWTSTVEPLTYPGVQSFATFRPAIDVEESVVIYVGEKSSAKAVQVAPGQPLFADPSVLPTKALFRCTGWTLGDTKIKAGENHMVTTEDDGKILVPTWEETPTSVTVKCENCLGPETAYPGQTVTVYPLEGMAFAAENPLAVAPDDGSVTVTPAEDGTLTVTFPETLPLDTEIRLTGTLVPIEEPEPEMKPGYRFRLR